MGDNRHTSEDETARDFIREKIVEQPVSKGGWCKRIAIGIILAIVFGTAAGITFALVTEWMQDSKENIANVSTEQITSEELLRTEPEEGPALEQTTEEQSNVESSSAEETSSFAETETRECSIYEQVKNSLLTISVTRNQGVDWFDTTLEHIGETFGVIVDVTDTEILILTNGDTLDGTETMSVNIGGKTVHVQLKQTDYTDGIALLSIDRQMVDISTNLLTPIPFGNSNELELGQEVVAVGSPMGYCPSFAYGVITYSYPSASSVDGRYQIYYTDMVSIQGAGGVLLNLKGEMVGWLTSHYKRNNLQSVTAAIGITDLQLALGDLLEGREIALLGIQGEEFLAHADIPEGYYVTSVSEGSPAYNAGIQSGDILVSIGENKITDWQSLQGAIRSYVPGNTATITILRKGREDYKQMLFDIIFVER